MAGITSKQLIIIGWAFVTEEIGCRGFLTKKYVDWLMQDLSFKCVETSKAKIELVKNYNTNKLNKQELQLVF